MKGSARYAASGTARALGGFGEIPRQRDHRADDEYDKRGDPQPPCDSVQGRRVLAIDVGRGEHQERDGGDDEYHRGRDEQPPKRHAREVY